MNATLNSSATIHTASTHEGKVIGTRCSAESLQGRRGARRFRTTDAAVTCKRCLKMAPVAETPAAPAAPAVRELVTFNVGSKRTRTSGPRHPLERDCTISGLGV